MKRFSAELELPALSIHNVDCGKCARHRAAIVGYLRYAGNSPDVWTKAVWPNQTTGRCELRLHSCAAKIGQPVLDHNKPVT